MENNPFTLKGKKILITGGSSGIGKACAIECSKLGAEVIITARNEARLNETFELLEGNGHLQFTSDLNNSERILDFLNPLPTLDGIAHCAGYSKLTPFKYFKENDLYDIMKVNFFSPLLITQGLIKRNKIHKEGSIVFISSISGIFCTSFGGGMYAATKGAINGIVKNMALELAVKGIRVNTVCPGRINTNIYASENITEEQLKADINKYPLKRYGRPEEVGYAAIYLLSDASKWVTGSNLLIDGGFTLL